jgi:sporulation protein YlmC with PRC-barrel domain
VDLIRDFLDKRVVDRNGREMGRVDRVVLEVRDGAPPHVVAFETGPAVLAARLSPRLGRWVEALEHAFALDAGRPLRIEFAEVLDVHDHIRIDRAAGETSAVDVEHRLRRWVRSIPGGS